MKTILKHTVLIVFFLFSLLSHAFGQTSLIEVTDPVYTSANTWKFGKVTITATENIKNIIIQATNNTITADPPTSTYTYRKLQSIEGSSSIQSTTYVLATALTATQAQSFIMDIVFTTSAGGGGKVEVTADSNPTNLPSEATTITGFNHPDGTVHYYIWVPSSKINFYDAYNNAKSFYFGGKRGYLPTITSEAEDDLLKNISNDGGWSGGTREQFRALDSTAIPFKNTSVVVGSTINGYFSWACGPEAGDQYFIYKSAYQVGVESAATANKYPSGYYNGAFNRWFYEPGTTDPTKCEPNNGGNYAALNTEWAMQMNFSSTGAATAVRYWNDLNPTGGVSAIKGYFVEFGGYSTPPPGIKTTNNGYVNYLGQNTSSNSANVVYPTVAIVKNDGSVAAAYGDVSQDALFNGKAFQTALNNAGSGEAIYLRGVDEYTLNGATLTFNGLYQGNFTINTSKNFKIYGGFAGEVNDWKVTDSRTAVTTLTANNQGRVLSILELFSGSLLIDGLTITNGNETPNAGSGGGIYYTPNNTSATMTINNCNITNNKAGYGGGVFIMRGAVKFTNGNISNNSATKQGGGVRITGGNLSMDNMTLVNNKAVENGGQFYSVGGNTIMSGTSLQGSGSVINAKNGGGIYQGSGELTLNSDCVITLMGASELGGGIYVEGGTFKNDGTLTITNNRANKGGGMYINTNVTLTGGLLSYNTASFGGGIYQAGNTITLSGSVVISGNTANGDNIAGNKEGAGGGIYAAGGTLNLNDGRITNNKAIGTNQLGGAIVVSAGAIVNLGSGSTFTVIDANTSTSGYGQAIYTVTPPSNSININFSPIAAISSSNDVWLSGSSVNINYNTVASDNNLRGVLTAGRNLKDGSSNYTGVKGNFGYFRNLRMVKYPTDKVYPNGLFGLTIPNILDTTNWAIGKTVPRSEVGVLKHYTDITFDVTTNGGTVTQPVVRAINSSEMPSVTSIPTKTGYTFSGYFDAATGGTKYYNANLSSAVEWDKTMPMTILYAQFLPIVNVVSLNANGGIVTPTTINVKYDAAYGSDNGLPTPTRTGYTFKHWNSAVGGTGMTVTAATTFTGANTFNTLYAQWEPITFTVVYNSNKPSFATGVMSGTMNNSSFTYDATNTLRTNTYSLTGWTFQGWSNNPTGTVIYNDAANVGNLSSTASSTVNLYAVWQPTTTTVTLDKNSGIGGTSSVTATYDFAMPMAAPPIRAGYSLEGYSTDGTSGGTKYYNNDMTSAKTWNNPATTPANTLKAIWAANKYTITFNSTFGTPSPATKEVTYGSTYETLATVSHSGYTFGGWFTSPSYTTEIKATDQVSTPADQVLYAKWTANTYTITFNAQSGTVSPSTMTVNYGSGYGSGTGLIANNLPTPVRTGSNFVGWFTAATGGTAVYASTPMLKTSDHTLHAQYVTTSYIVSFDANGGAVSPVSTSVSYGKTYGEGIGLSGNLPTPTRTGYIFEGWWTTATTGGAQVTGTTSVSLSANQTLYARWKAITYSVKYNMNKPVGATSTESGSMGNSSHTYDVAKNLTANGFTLPGWTFSRWDSRGDGIGTGYTPAQSVINLSNIQGSTVDIYAQWTANTYTITLNSNYGTPTTTTSAVYDSPMPGVPPLIRIGYTFNGYFDATSGGIKYYNADGTSARSWNKTANTTLYAQWTANTYTLSFDTNSGGSVTNPTDVTVTFGNNYPNLPTVTRSGYTFAGWFTAPVGGTQITNTIAVTTYYDHTVFAHWTAQSYTVTFDVQGGTPNPSSLSVMSNTIYGTLPSVTKTGYLFNGWFTAATSGTQIFGSTLFTNNANQILYAQWSPINYTIVYQGNKPTAATNPVNGSVALTNATYGAAATLRANTFTLTGWTFRGWAQAPDASTPDYTMPGGSALNLSSTQGDVVYLYAIWQQGTSTVTFNIAANGGSGTQANVTATYDKAMPAITTIPTKSGSSFSGYWDSQVGGTQYYAANLASSHHWDKTTSPVTLYAQFSSNNYYVNFNANGGTGTMTTQTFFTGVAQPLTTNTFTRTGYTFAGWNTAADGTGTNYTNGQSVTNLTATDNTVTLYAKWTSGNYNVVYNANKPASTSGTISGVTATSNHSYDVSSPLTSNGYRLDGWSFTGWNTAADGNGTPYTDGGNAFNLAGSNSSVTIYAQWQPNHYTVFYQPNLPSGVSRPINGNTTASNHVYDTPKVLTNNGYTLTGWNFAGWASAADGTGTSYTNGQSVSNLTTTNNGIYNLHAKWTAKTSTITYNLNGGTGTQGTTTATYDSPMPAINVILPTKAGYTFTGYFSAATGGTQYYNTAGSSTKNWDKEESSVTLYAQWSSQNYYVNFNANGGVGAPIATQTFLAGVAKALSSNTYDRIGYTFDGWTENSDGSGTVYSDNQSVNNLTAIGNTITLYAKWKAKSYTVNYSSNQPGGASAAPTGNTESSDHIYDKAEPLKDNGFSLTGWMFMGWNTQANGSGIPYPAGTSVFNLSIGGAVTLYAQWNPITYTVFYNSNAPSATTPPAGETPYTTHIYDVETSLSTNGFSVSGWKFLRWNTHSNGSGTNYNNNASVKNLTTTAGSPVTLYSIWARETTTISFDANGGTVTQPNIVAKYDSVMPQITNRPVRSGYAFTGYFDAPDGGTQYYNSDLTSAKMWNKVGATATLYAQWKANSYSVQFSSNGGTGINMTTEEFLIGVEKRLPRNTYIKTGYTFAGWNTDLTTETVLYTEEQLILATSPLTSTAGNVVILYVVWQPVNYTIQYDKNAPDAVGTMEATTHTYDVPQNLRENGYSRTGRTFKGWTVNQNGTGIVYANQQEVINLTNVDGNVVTLYAQWEGSSIAVYYDITKNGGTGEITPPSNVVIFGSPMPPITGTVTKVGYDFDGFWDEPVGGVQYYDKDLLGTKEWDKTTGGSLYAQFITKRYKVTLDPGTGSMAGARTFYVFYDSIYGKPEGKTDLTPLPKVTKVDFSFDGWFTSLDDTGVLITEQTKVTTTEDITLYAKFTPITLTLISGDETLQQNICINTPLQDIVYIVHGTTNYRIDNFPEGIEVNLQHDTITISGRPTKAGIFHATLTIGGGGEESEVYITVRPQSEIVLSSAPESEEQVLKIPNSINLIEYKIKGADSIRFTKIPSWLNYSLTENISSKDLTLSLNGQPNKSGMYSYSFQLINGCGNITGNGVVSVIPAKGEIIVVTPNGDGLNDVVEMEAAKHYTNNEFTIYSRFGNIIYQQKNYNNDFDGSVLRDGVYIYVFKYMDENNKEQVLSNSVNIIR